MKSVKNNKASKIKSFFFFLLLAILFWGLTKLSKQYTANVETMIEYTNIPLQMMLDEGNVDRISFEISANGFEFLTYKLKVPILKIDVESFFDEKTGKASISKSNIIRLVSEQLEKGVAIKNVSVNELNVSLSSIISKKIPLIGQLDIAYRNGFNSVDSLIVSPDSVTISGPEQVIKDIDHIKTVPLKIKEADKDIQEVTPLLLPENGIISVDHKSATLQLKVKEFAQMEIKVPLEVINLPSDIKLKLIPENVRVSFSISIDDFKNTSVNDFIIICDYSKRISDGNYFIPLLLSGPKNARSIEIIDKKIDFLIFK